MKTENTVVLLFCELTSKWWVSGGAVWCWAVSCSVVRVGWWWVLGRGGASVHICRLGHPLLLLSASLLLSLPLGLPTLSHFPLLAWSLSPSLSWLGRPPSSGPLHSCLVSLSCASVFKFNTITCGKLTTTYEKVYQVTIGHHM